MAMCEFYASGSPQYKDVSFSGVVDDAEIDVAYTRLIRFLSISVIGRMERMPSQLVYLPANIQTTVIETSMFLLSPLGLLLLIGVLIATVYFIVMRMRRSQLPQDPFA
ncbi:MAG: hypothetical protein ACFFAZ_03275 [Promethearchaeota archaeon]